MNKLFELKFGSHLYGTDTASSDTDIKSIYIPSPREICLNSYKKTLTTVRPKRTGERNNKDDIDIEVISLDQFMRLLADGQIMVLDMLFAPDNMFSQTNNDTIWPYIKRHKDKLLSKETASFFGYAKQQAQKYGLKGFRVAALREVKAWLDNAISEDYSTYFKPLSSLDPHSFVSALGNKHVKIVSDDKCSYLEINDKKYQLNVKIKLIKENIDRAFHSYGHRSLLAEKSEGVDWKALSHAVRVNSEGVELLTTGKITFPRPDRELLLKIKTGQMQYKEVAEIIEQGLIDLTEAQKVSKLREKPDYEWIDNFIYDVYSQVVKDEF
jgi:hypothetical protein